MKDTLGESLEIQLHVSFNGDLEIGIYMVSMYDIFLLERHFSNTFLIISFEKARGNIMSRNRILLIL